MKKKAIELLTTKFSGVSENILSRIADKLLKTAETEEALAEAVDKVTMQQLLESYADSRVTEAQKTAVDNYKRKHGIVEDPEPTKQKPKSAEPAENNTAGEDMPAWAKKLIEANEALTKEITAIKTEKLTSSRESSLANALKGIPEQMRSRYLKDFKRLSFADDEDFTKWIDEVTNDATEIAKTYGSNGSKFSAPKTGNKQPPEQPNPHHKARIDAAAKQAVQRPSVIIGMPTNNVK